MEGGGKIGAGGEGVAVRFVHFRLGVFEVDAGEGLGDVKVAGFAFGIGAVPIENAVGGVGVLLDLVDEETGADGVEAAGLDEDGLAFLRGDGVDLVGDRALGDGLFKGLSGHSFFQADVKFRPRLAVGDVPHLGLRFATEFFSNIRRWVNLDGEVVGAIENLDKEGETVGVREVFSKNFLSVFGPEMVQGFSGKLAGGDDGLGILAINDLPCFAERCGGVGECAVVCFLKLASSPDAGHVDRLEGDGLHGCQVTSDRRSVEEPSCGVSGRR